MRPLELGVASAIAAFFSVGVEAADLAYPPSALGSYPPMSTPAPQVLVIPGGPAPLPQYYGQPTPPLARSPIYSGGPPITPPEIPPGPLPPRRAACEPVWQCGNGGCGWTPSCAPNPDANPEANAAPYPAPSPHVYSQAGRPTDAYVRPYATSPGPQVYSPAPQPYVRPYASQSYGPYGPEVYSRSADRMRWIVGPQPYGM